MTATTYAQHPALTLPPWDSLTPLDQALHLVHDHGFDPGSDSRLDELASPEAAVTVIAGWDAVYRDDLHAEDHGEGQTGLAEVGADPDTQTWNVHRHRRSVREFARAVARFAGAHDTFATDPGGYAGHVYDPELDGPHDLADVTARAAFALLAHDALWIEVHA